MQLRARLSHLYWQDMSKYFLSLLLTAAAGWGQYKTEPAGAPPSELNASVVGLLNKEGIKVSDGSKVVAEIWFRSSLPGGGKAEDSKSFSDVPNGALFGAIRFPIDWNDRRGQKVKAGVYTLRYSLFPQNGDHQGAAPQRDFLLLLKPSDDTRGGESRLCEGDNAEHEVDRDAASGGVQHLEAGCGGFQAGVAAVGEHDQVVNVKIGETPVSMILFGKAEG